MPDERLPLAVALSGSRDPGLRAEAEACARRWNVPLLLRPHKAPLHGLLRRARALVVLGQDGIVLRDDAGHASASAGMAALRIDRIDGGRVEDALQRIGELVPGERVLDATLGFAQDARVAARLVGPTGSVVGIEASLPLAVLADAALARERASGAWPLSAGIEVRHGDSAALLRTLPAGAFDVVLLDPMFAKALAAQPPFELLRRHAEHAPLTRATLAEARRVARRVALVKGARYTADLRTLGLRPERASRDASVVWARVPGDGSSPGSDPDLRPEGGGPGPVGTDEPVPTR